jgi:hypothetical protein
MVIPTRPTQRHTGSTKKKSSGSSRVSGSPGGGSSGGGGGGSKKSSGGGGGGAGGAERRAVKRENAAKKKAGKRFLESAANLELQAKSLRHALKTDFAKARDQDLTDVSTVLAGQIAQLKLGAGKRAKTFLDAADNTTMATASSAEQGIGNMTRERAESMASILEQGAGETDAMRARLISARNWQANAQEANRAFYDSMQTVNSGITDLNEDNRTAFANAYSTAEAERDRLWSVFYNKRSETFTNLGNVLGQQADYYAQAKEMGVKPKKGAEKKAEKEMAKSWMSGSTEAGKSYVQKKLPDWVAKYEGQAQVKTKLSNTNLAAAIDLGEVKKAEGSTLKKWKA